jgi:ribosomal protection tetracycline resistance protein
VQAQTRVLMRALQRLRVPTLIFVNKIDRRGARFEPVLHGIRDKLSPAIVAMGSAGGLGTRGASFAPYRAGDAPFARELVELLADHDDALLAAYVDDESAVSYARLRGGLAAQARRARVHPVFFGSARTGAGVDELTAGIADLLPAAEAGGDGPVSGTVFKIERGPRGEKIAYVRMFSGTVRTRDRLRIGDDGEGKVTAVSGPDGGAAIAAGQIGKLWGLGDVRIGDAIGTPRTAAPGRQSFAPPTLETVVVPRRRADRGALRVALDQLAEQDPLIDLRQDELRQEISVSLYGEVQKQVIQATLANDFGVDVTFRATTTICIERPDGTGAAAEILGEEPNPFLATVGLRIDPAPIGSGVEFRLEVELGSMPFAFFRAVEETVKETLRQGLHGWEVTDCTVTMTHSGYAARQSHAHAVFDKSMSSTAGDFRNLTPLVLMSALRRAGTRVYEPMHRFQLEIPADTLGAVPPVLVQLGGVPQATAIRGPTCTLEGEVPAARVHELRRQLPALTRGEGILETAFERYHPVRGEIPDRPRSDDNPLDREEYLRRLAGR